MHTVRAGCLFVCVFAFKPPPGCLLYIDTIYVRMDGFVVNIHTWKLYIFNCLNAPSGMDEDVQRQFVRSV